MPRCLQAVSAATCLAIAAFVGGVACGGGSDGGAVEAGASCRTDGCTPTALAAMQKGAHAIVANATSVYWVRNVSQPDGGAATEIVECAKAGCNGAPTVLAVDTGVVALAVDATNAYWITQVGTISKVGLAGGTPTTLASGPSGAVRIAVDAANVYWATNAFFATTGAVSTLMKVPIAGGNPTTLASNISPVDIAVDGTNVYWTNGLESHGGTVMKVSIDGGAPTTLASGLDSPASLAVDGTYVYWTELTSVGSGVTGNVMRVPIGGGTPTTIASQQADPSSIAVDATSVYWTNNAGGTVLFAPLGGGAALALASGQDGPSRIVVDATGIYWGNEGTGVALVGSIMKLPPGCCGRVDNDVSGGLPSSSDSGQDGASSNGSASADGSSRGQEAGEIECVDSTTCRSGQVCCAIVTSEEGLALAATSACQDGPCASNTNTYQLCAFPSECLGGATCEPNPIGMGSMICTSRNASGDGGPPGDGG
jgi:hypothetical protein